MKGRDLSFANDDEIPAGVFGRFAPWAGTPRQTTGVVKSLGFAVRCVDEIRVRCAKLAGESVESVVPGEYALRHVEHAVLGVELLDGGATTLRVTFAEDLPNIAQKQFVSAVVHDAER